MQTCKKILKINRNQWKSMQSIKMNKHLENQWKSTEIKENQAKYIKTIS